MPPQTAAILSFGGLLNPLQSKGNIDEHRGFGGHPLYVPFTPIGSLLLQQSGDLRSLGPDLEGSRLR